MSEDGENRPEAEPADAELIAGYLGGDEQQFSRLYERYRKPLYGYLNKMLPGQAAVADDVYQQTWLKAVDSLARYEHRQSFFGWLVRIAHNTAIDHFRRERNRESVELDELQLPETKDIPWRHLRNEELARAIAAAVAELPADQREVFLLRQRDVPFKEIAELQNCSINTVLGRMHYAVNRLRQTLRDWQ